MEEIIEKIYFDVENLEDNNEQDYINHLYENEDVIEQRILNLIEEYELEFNGDINELVDYYIDRLSVYAD